MLFKKRSDYVVFPGITGLGNDGFYGQTFRAEITREFPVEAIYLKLQFSLTVATSVTFVFFDVEFGESRIPAATIGTTSSWICAG